MSSVTNMVENLERIYREDPDLDLSEKDQYLLEKVETINDLWDFLNVSESIEIWGPTEIFGFVVALCWVTPEEPGFDPGAPLSDAYHKAKGNEYTKQDQGSRDPDIYSDHPNSYE